MIQVENLRKTYEMKTRKGFLKSEKSYLEAVRGINMEIREGKITGLLGINGAGKTTTIKMLSTLLLPTSGSIMVDGVDAVKMSMKVKSRINMVAGGERMIYWRLTGRENLWYYGQLYGIDDKVLTKRIDELLELVGITEKKDTPVENYSKGMKQRLQIARGLINSPDYLFMDEPTLGLDAVISKELRKHIKGIATQEGKGILLTSHYMYEIEELCDYVYILNNGVIIAQGTPKDLASLGMSRKKVHLALSGADPGIYESLEKECLKEDKSAAIVRNEAAGTYIISCAKDIKPVISAHCLNKKLVILKLHEEEPKLEDAIIRLAKEVS